MKRSVCLLLTGLFVSTAMTLPALGDTIPFTWDSTNGFRTINALKGSLFTHINDNGLMAGVSGNQGFTWDGTTKREVGMLPGYGYSSIDGLNNSGKVIGTCTSKSGGSPYRAFTWDATNGIKDLGLYDSVGDGINNYGTVCGEYRNNTSNRTPIIWNSATGKTDITIPADFYTMYPGAINDNNVIVGYGYGPGCIGTYGFVWDSVHGAVNVGTLVPTPLQYYDVELRDINNSGQAVGNDGFLPVIWDRVNGLKSLGLPTGYYWGIARKITDSGLVLGTLIPESGKSAYFLWDSTHGMQIMDFGKNDFVSVAAMDINNNGVVVGYATTPPLPTPEPSSIAGMLAGITGTACMFRRKRRC